MGTTTMIDEAGDVKVKKRVGMPHIYNRVPDTERPGKLKPSTVEMKDTDFIDFIEQLKHELKGKLDGIQINLKVDGAGVRFGKDSSGEPFFATSSAGAKTAKDIGSFLQYNVDNGVTDPVMIGRAKMYDKMLATIVKAGFMRALPSNCVVQAEMLFNDMAEKTASGFKFVNINYDPKLLGSVMTLVPFTVTDAGTGEALPNQHKIIEQLIAASSPEIKIISNALEQKDIDVNAIIDPVASMNGDLKAALLSRKASDNENKELAKEIIVKTKRELSDFVLNHPNIIGKTMLGKELEGIVLNIPDSGPVKITSPLMQQLMQVKKDKEAELRKQQQAKPVNTGNKTRTAVFTAGSFVGHRGHQQLVNLVLAKAKAVNGDPYVYISPNVGPDDPIPGEVKLQTWKKLYPEYANIFQLWQAGGTPIKKVEYELVRPENSPYKHIIGMVGTDRYEGFKSWMDSLAKRMTARDKEDPSKFAFPGPWNYVTYDIELTNRGKEQGGTGISFTQCRNILKDARASYEQKFAFWEQAFTPESNSPARKLDNAWIEHLMQVAAKGMGVPLEVPSQVVKGKPPVMEFIEELSRPGAEPHPEDSIFQSADAANKMLQALIGTIQQPENVTIKWDGYPALIFGRLADGRFCCQDKYMFDNKKFADSPEAVKEYDKGRGKDRGDLYHKLANIWHGLEESTKNSKGFFWGDLLWGEPLKPAGGVYAFKPNVVEYRVEQNSPFGKLAAGKNGGIVVHQYFAEDGAKAVPWNGKGLTPTNSVAIINPSAGIRFTLNDPVQLTKGAKMALQKYGQIAESYLAGLDAGTQKLIKQYFNKKITNQTQDDLNTWLSRRTETNESVGGQGLTAVTECWNSMYRLKTNLAQQLEQQVRGLSQHVNGTPQGEGFVASTPDGLVKLVNRQVFSAANFADKP